MFTALRYALFFISAGLLVTPTSKAESLDNPLRGWLETLKAQSRKAMADKIRNSPKNSSYVSFERFLYDYDKLDAEKKKDGKGCYVILNGKTMHVSDVIPFAESGNAWAQYFAGRAFADIFYMSTFEKRCLSKDAAKAAMWYQKSAENGHAEAQYFLGLAYYNGQGVPKNSAVALDWLQKAAKTEMKRGGQYYAKASPLLRALDYEENDAKELRNSAARGNAEAQYKLGVKYLGGMGVPQNFIKLITWTKKAAQQGHMTAQGTLCEMLGKKSVGADVFGNIRPYDPTQAKGWCEKAARQGEVRSMLNLAIRHQYGSGMLQDYVEAHKWYNLAAARAAPYMRDHYAKSRDELASKKMTREQVAEAQRRARDWKPTRSK